MKTERSLDHILESAVISSSTALTHGAQAGLIHIEYGFAVGGTLDYLKVSPSLTRGRWLMACEYWMASSKFHNTGVRFDNGYESEELAHILEFVMQHQNSFVLPPEPRPAGTAPDFHAYGRGKRIGGGNNKRKLRPPRFIARAARSRLKISARVTFPGPPKGGRDAVLFGVGQC